MRLIDADELKLDLKWLEDDTPVYHDVMSTIDERPTVDAVEVVRCRDCRFFEDEDYYGNCYCEEWGNITNANGYCHDAERRKDGERNNS